MPRTIISLSLFGLLGFSTAWAQSPLAGAQMPNIQGNPPAMQGTRPSDEVPLADYLALLRQIAPAARLEPEITSPLSYITADAP